MNRITSTFLIIASTLGFSACASLKLEQVDYAWPVESVVTVTNGSNIDEVRYGLFCSIAKLSAEEFQDSTALRGVKLRLLRNNEGFYFITGPRFKHVYVFEPGLSELSLKTSIEVSKTGLRDPAFNQRSPLVELVDGESFDRMLTSDGMVEVKKP